MRPSSVSQQEPDTLGILSRNLKHTKAEMTQKTAETMLFVLFVLISHLFSKELFGTCDVHSPTGRRVGVLVGISGKTEY